MRDAVYLNRLGWIGRLDYRRLIVIAILSRLIFASAYDSYVSLTGKEILLPDASFYSMRGKYLSTVLNGYDNITIMNVLPSNDEDRRIFLGALEDGRGGLLPVKQESDVFIYVVGGIYFIFGYLPLAVRILNIALSIGSAYLLFRIARKHFGQVTANLFLLVVLFLPTQFIYSATLSRDFIRMFAVSLILWRIYD